MAREFDWLEEKHPVFVAGTTGAALGSGLDFVRAATQPGGVENVPVGPWLRNERRLRGGDAVTNELKAYDYEQEDGPSHKSRKAQATYINFPEGFAVAMVGSIMRHRPEPDHALSFGTLGTVRRERNLSRPTRAEMIFYNASGQGNAGAQWDSFWSNAMKRAMATGHRWIMAEAPAAPLDGRRLTEADEIAGKRPYLVEYSPIQVPNWDFDEAERLNFVVMRTSYRQIKVDDTGKMDGNKYKRGYLLLVRKGYDGLGSLFTGGGWWRFTDERDLIPGAAGNWDRTDGEIPMWPLYYERDNGTDEMPAMSRPALTDLGNLAVSYMNVSSAADTDAIDAAASVTFLLNVDPDQFNTAMKKVESGNRYAPIPPRANTNLSGEEGPGAEVHDGSQGAVPAEVFEKRLAAKEREADRLSSQEQTSAPESSGVSKVAGFNEVKNPRLALMAEHMEEAQNTAIYFLERRWGSASPTGYVTWRRDFDLMPLSDEIKEFVELEVLAGVSSPTAKSIAMTKAVREKRIITDDGDLKTVEAEYKKAVDSAAEADEEMRQAELENMKQPTNPVF